jgi:hypothetical protein
MNHQPDPLVKTVFHSMCAKLDDGCDANFRGTLAFAAQLVVAAMREKGMEDKDILKALVGEARELI